MTHYIYAFIDTPCGELLLVEQDGALVWAAYVMGDGREHALERVKHWFSINMLESGEIAAAKAINAYFNGDIRALGKVKVAFVGGTAFQRAVWQAIAEIPYGRVISYADLAEKVGRPKAVRAAGSACGKNPISVVVPCHRVVGTNRRLHGYGGGLDKKSYLLQLEQVEDITLAA